MAGILFVQKPIHDVAPSAVSTADAIETINCVTNLIVSLFVITYLLSLMLGTVPKTEAAPKFLINCPMADRYPMGQGRYRCPRLNRPRFRYLSRFP